MKKKILSFLVFSIFFLLLSGFLTVLPTNAQTDPTLTGLNQTADQVEAFKQAKTTYNSGFLQTKAGQIVGVVLSFVGVIFLALMIYAGISWMTAAGNDQQVTKAKSLMVNATIGIIIVFAAYAITSFIGIQVLK
jgi:hypothetical protein